ncbi:MAG: shikimate kinase [Polyangiaceae bacterium]
MARIVLFGNSGSGKSTLALRLARDTRLPHLDLDVVAWTGAEPPERRAAAESARDIEAFMEGGDGWVIEGCYADLVAVAARRATCLVFLNPGMEACKANARARPWEPHKYTTKEKQDAGLAFLLGWIGEYETREDVYSLKAHRAVFDAFKGDRVELTSREAIAAYDGTAQPRIASHA